MIQAVQADGTILEFPDGTPDSVIDQAVQEYIGGLPKPEYVYPYAARDKAGFFDRVGESFESGVSKLRGLSASAVEATGELTGSEDLTGFGREGREAFVKREQEREIPAIQFTDIDNLGDVGEWLTDTIPEQTVMFAPSIAGGLVGAKLGTKAGAAVGAFFGGVGAIPGAAIGGTIGSLLGAFIPSLTLGVGEVQESIKSKDSSVVNPEAAFAGGTAIAALDSILPGKIGGQLVKRLGTESAEEVAKRTLLKPIKREYLKAAGKGMAVEGITEAMQEAIAEVTAVEATGQELDGAELRKMMINAGAAGALMGGGVRTASERFKKTRTQDEVDQVQKLLDKQEAEREARAREVITPDPDGPLLLSYNEAEFTTDSPSQVVETIIDESVNNVAPTGLGEDIGSGAPLGPFTVREMPNGGFAVVNAAGEVRTPSFQTLDLAQEAANLLTERVPTAIEAAEVEFTQAAASRALEDNKIEETAATLDAARETVTPLGFFSREEVGKEVASQIDRKRTMAVSLRPGEIVQNDGLYTIEEVAETGASNKALSAIIAKKRPLTEDASLNVTVRDIEDLASTKNIRFGDESFKTFALRTTGKSMPQNMSQVQRNALFERLDAMPEFKEETSIPVIKYPHFTAQQIADVAKAIRETGTAEVWKDTSKPPPKAAKVSDKLILEAVGAPNIKGARRKEVAGEIRRELIRRGILDKNGTIKRRLVLRGSPERTAPPSVKKQELLQRLKPLARAINDRFQARVKANPALEGVRLKFNNLIESIESGEIQADAEGVFRAEEEAGQLIKTIRLALDPVVDPSKSDQENISALAEVLDHEFIHAAYEAGVVTDQEKAALESFVKKAKRPGTDKTYYEDRAEALRDNPPSEEILVEEAVAEAFRDYAAGRRVFPPKTRNIFRKIAEFFRLVKEAAADADIITGNEIFQRLDAGAAPLRGRRSGGRATETTATPVNLNAAETATVEREGRVPDFPTAEKFSRKRARKTPAPVGDNPFPTPPEDEIQARLGRKAKRTDVAGATESTGPRNPRQEIVNDDGEVVAVVGKITFDDWINQTETRLDDAGIAAAREWYPEAAKSYQKYFGKDWPNFLAAWLMANQQASPSTAAMNAVRSREQALTQAAQAPVSQEVEAGLAADRLFDFWMAMEAGGELPSGGAQKLYDFIDSGLLRETRSWMGDDVRGGAPAVADVHSLRDTGFVDATYQKFLQENYGVRVETDTSGSPGENQYERSGDFMRALSDHLNDINYKGGGWTPYQVQSVGWMATTKFLGKPGQTAEDSILFNIRNLPFEVAFGEGSPYSETFVDYYQLPAIGQKEVTGIAAEAAADFAREVTGVAEINRYVSTGGWLDDSLNPNMVEQVVASPEAMMDMASIIGYAVEQTGMFPYRIVPTKTGKSKLALKIRPSDVSKDLLNNDTNMAILWDKIRNAELAGTKKAEKQLAKERKAGKEDARLPDEDNIITGYTGTIDENGNSSMLILFDTKKAGLLARLEPDGDVISAISKISEEMGFDLDVEAAYYEGDYIENNWTEDKEGGGYLQRIHQRYGPAVAERVKNFKRGQLEPLLEDSITSARLKYGNREKFSRRSTDSAVESRIPDRAGLSRSERQLQAQDRSGATAQEEVRVEGLPASYNIPGTGPVPTEPFAPARQAAREYGQTVGRSVPELVGNYVYGPVDGERATRIAQAYEDMPNTPEDSFTQAAYEALAEEVMTQYDFIKDTGLEVEFYPSDVDPYAASPREMIEDVKQNNHMYVFPTDAGFGTDGITAEEVADNPMLRLTDEFISGRRARVNDIFRAVHDYFGHVKEGFGFRAAGEDAAYASHAVMFSPLARAALASETRGQNSWVNFGPAAKQNENASAVDTVYADQKVGILPEFVINEGIETLVEPVNLQELQDETGFNTQENFVPDERFSRKYPQDPRNAAPNRFVKRARADGTRSDVWGKLPFNTKFLNVRMSAGQNYETGGYGQAHAGLHDDHFRGIEDLPFTSSDAAIAAALDAYTEARVSGVDKSRFKFVENRRAGSLEMLWKPVGSKTQVKVVFDTVTDAKSGQEFLGITTAYPNSEVMIKDNLREDVENYRKANHLGPKFSALSTTAQETALTFKTKKPTGRPVLKLNKAAKEKFSRGGTVKDESPEVQETINKTQAVNTEETAGQAWLSAIFGDYTDSVLFSNNWDLIKSQFRKNILNKYEAISVLSRKAAKIAGEVLADASAFSAVLMAEQHAGVTKAAFYDGVPVYDKELGFTYVTSDVEGQSIRGLAFILSPVLENRVVSQFGTYAQARRAQRLNKQKINSGMTDQDVLNGLSLGDKYDYFAEVFDEYQVWNSYLVKYMVDTGLITAEMGQTWINTADYTPYYRQSLEGADGTQDLTYFYPGDPTLGTYGQGLAPLEGAEGSGRSRIPLDGKRVDKRLVGAGRVFQIDIDGQVQPEQYDSYNKAVASVRALRQSNPDVSVDLYAAPRRVDDFLDNVARNTATAIQGGMKNIAAQRVIRDSLTLGVASEVTPDESGNKPRQTVQIRVDGVDRYFEIVDEFLYTSMTILGQNTDSIMDNVFVGFAASPARVLRELVTRDPGFMLRNMMRDTLSAWVTSGQNYIPVIDSAKGVMDVIRGSESSEALRMAGVFGGFDFAGNPKDMAKYIKGKTKTQKPSGVLETAASPFKKLWDATTVATNASEASTRIAVYKRVLEKTGNEAQAVFEALEVLNFSRRGSSATIRLITAVTPFLNARLQGLDVLYRAGFSKETANPNASRKAALAKASLIVGTTALYSMLMRDADCYKNATAEARDLNWFVPTPFGGACVKIPVPFEVGFLFKTMPERIMQWSFDSDTGKDVLDSLIRGITSTLAVNPPQIITPALEVRTNYSIFSGREIVPAYMKNLDPDYQKFQGTSSLALNLAKQLNISPLKIDHLIKGYTGTLGSYGLSAASHMIDAFQSPDKPLPPDKNWYSLPMVRSFFQDPNSRGTVIQFYELDQLVKTAVNTFKAAEREGDVEKITEIATKRGTVLALENEVKKIRQQLKEVREQKNEILRSPIDPEVKRELLNIIRQQELAITAAVPILRQIAVQ